MKLIATNIFDFTAWYKFGFKFIDKDVIIDLSNDELTGKLLLERTGFFEEDFDVFFLEISNDNLKYDHQFFKLSLSEIINIIPLTEKGSNILSNKLPDFKFSNPLNQKIAKLLFEERNKELAVNGGNRLLASFDIPKIDYLDLYQEEFLVSLSKYSEDLNSELDSMMDSLLFYERSKPYPLTDLGFLYDVGGITMSRFNISEDDIRDREILKENDSNKYEFIEEIIALSKFLQSIKDEKIWSNFLSEYNNNSNLLKLSDNLSLVNNNLDINNILIIAYYQKFRYLIRNTSNLEDKVVKTIIKKFFENVPNETTIALYLVGMFFGSLKFKDIYYKNKPLEISKPIVNTTNSFENQQNTRSKSKMLNSNKTNKFKDKIFLEKKIETVHIQDKSKNLENKININNSELNDTDIEYNFSKTIEEIVEWFNSNKEVSVTNKKIWNKLSKSFLSGERVTLIYLKEFITTSGHKKILTQKVEKELIKFFTV
jgi:hypothetical protein